MSKPRKNRKRARNHTKDPATPLSRRTKTTGLISNQILRLVVQQMKYYAISYFPSSQLSRTKVQVQKGDEGLDSRVHSKKVHSTRSYLSFLAPSTLLILKEERWSNTVEMDQLQWLHIVQVHKEPSKAIVARRINIPRLDSGLHDWDIVSSGWIKSWYPIGWNNRYSFT